MFRLLRLVILLCIAFGAGFLYAETTRADRCVAMGGTSQDGLCLGILE